MVIDGILDANIVIDILKNKPVATQWSITTQSLRLALTPIVFCEVLQGALNKPEADRIQRFLRKFPIEHPFPDDNRWAMLQLSRFNLSHGVHYQDVMIASVAVRLNVPLYTLNLKHYAPLPGVNAVRPY